jgi:hypothetical protein
MDPSSLPLPAIEVQSIQKFNVTLDSDLTAATHPLQQILSLKRTSIRQSGKRLKTSAYSYVCRAHLRVVFARSYK